MDAATLLRLLEVANVARRRRRGGDADVRVSDAESQLEQLHHHSERLAVYGTLAPGRSNHHVVAPLGGTWARGRVRGDLLELGWGAAAGYPALRLRADGPWVSVHVLESPELRTAWPTVDAFEGTEYLRVLVAVYDESEDEPSVLTVANLYEIAP